MGYGFEKIKRKTRQLFRQKPKQGGGSFRKKKEAHVQILQNGSRDSLDDDYKALLKESKPSWRTKKSSNHYNEFVADAPGKASKNSTKPSYNNRNNKPFRKVNEMASFATIGSAAIVASLSNDDTKSTQESDYHERSLYDRVNTPVKEETIHPVFCKRDIFVQKPREPQETRSHRSQGSNKYRSKRVEPPGNTYRPAREKPRYGHEELLQEDAPAESMPSSLPSFAVAGSMLCSSIQSERPESNGTRKIQHQRKASAYGGAQPRSLPENTIMASMLYRTLPADNQKRTNNQSKSRSDGRKQVADYYDSEEDYDSNVPHSINRTDSKDGGVSTVSSVTMYSTYNHDPMVRASNNLLDNILRSNKFEEFKRQTQTLEEVESSDDEGLFEA